MLAKEARLKKQNIQYLLKKGDLRHTPFFIIREKSNIHNYARFGVIISKKLLVKAIDRNKLRRQIYNAIKELALENPEITENSHDRILIPKKSILKSDFQSIKNALKHLLNG